MKMLTLPALFAAFVLLPRPQDAAAQVRAARLQEIAVQGDEVRIKTSQPVSHNEYVEKSPPRLIVELVETESLLGQKAFSSNGQWLKQVRSNQFKVEQLLSRVVFDLVQPAAYRVEADGNDLVVTFGETKPQPAAVKETTAAAASAPAEREEDAPRAAAQTPARNEAPLGTMPLSALKAALAGSLIFALILLLIVRLSVNRGRPEKTTGFVERRSGRRPFEGAAPADLGQPEAADGSPSIPERLAALERQRARLVELAAVSERLSALERKVSQMAAAKPSSGDSSVGTRVEEEVKELKTALTSLLQAVKER